MDAEQARKDDIFDAAADVADAVERAAYLERACGRNVALRAEIEKLLEHDRAEDGLLDRTTPGLSVTLDHVVAERPGTLIGPYKLLEQIGEGGMGVVYVAEQRQPISRKVALKIIKPGMDTRAVVARFEAERQALALMEHPNIAKVFMDTFVAAGSGGLSNPMDLAFGPDGDLYVVSAGSNAICRYDGATGAFVETFVPNEFGGLATPIGMSFGTDGNLYVSNLGTDSVLRYQGPLGSAPGDMMSSDGHTGANLVASGSGGLAGPLDLTFGPDGSLYVASVGSSTNAAVLRFDGTTGEFQSTYIESGMGDLETPRGLVFDQEGRLYVADSATDAIHRFDTQADFLDDPVSSAATTLRAPIGLTFDTQGMLLITSRDTNEVVRCAGGVTVSLSEASATPVSLSYSTADGTATSGVDYTGQVGTVTFAPGQTTQHILLVARDDTSLESNELFSVVLTDPVGGTLSDDTGDAR